MKTYSASYAAYLGRRRFLLLDGLRAMSILAVIWHHTAPASMYGAWYVAAGTKGVTLFFAISGFLITSLLLRERDRSGDINLAGFYWRRMLRIFPLYYFVLLLYVVVVWVIERHTTAGQQFFGNLVYFATYTSNVFVALEERTIFYFAWSLATEEQFYLVWPPLLLLLRKNRLAIAVLSVVLAVLVIDGLVGESALQGVPIAIVGGALLAFGFHDRRGYAFMTPVLAHRIAAPTLLIALVASLAIPGVPEVVPHLTCVALVGACIMREDGRFAAVLQWKWLVHIGAISYGMYLYHMLCKSVITKLLPHLHIAPDGIQVFVLTTLATIVVATLSYRYFEAYFLSFKDRRTSGRALSGAAVT